MINISDATRTAYLSNSQKKELVISTPDLSKLDGVNLYFGGVWYSHDITIYPGDEYVFSVYSNPWNGNLEEYITNDYLSYRKYQAVSFYSKWGENTLGETCRFRIYFYDKNGILRYYETSRDLTITEMLTEDRYRWKCDINASTGFSGYKRISLKNTGTIPIVGEIFFNRLMYEVGDNINILPTPYTTAPCDTKAGYADCIYIDTGWFEDIMNNDLAKESFSLTESLCSEDNIKFGLCESSYVSFSVYDRSEEMKGREISVTQIVNNEAVPLGKFIVSDVKKKIKGTLVQKQVTAYDGLLKLEENAADWYTKYMYCLDIDGSSLTYGARYARQIYSTYYNFARTIGIENPDDYTTTSIRKVTKEQVIAGGYDSSAKITKGSRTLRCAYFFVEITDTSKPYVFTKQNLNNKTDTEMMTDIITGWDDVFGRGAIDACIMIYEGTDYQNLQLQTRGTLLNFNDQFMFRKDTGFIMVRIPMSTNTENMSAPIYNWIELSKVNRTIDLENSYVKLLYYNWSSKEVFPCESSITGRDVMRSLIEVCGCFFRLDRYGKPQFMYCSKSSLYPSNELYPDNELYPRGSSVGGNIPAGLYYDFTCEDYSVKDYGKIQIKKNSNSSDSKSIVEWQYIGNASMSNAYIIEDNIFYCSSEMMYEYDSMEEVSEMLENMYLRICNMGFTPCDVNAIGMPYLECGDRVTLLTANSGFETFIFSRTLSGIQALTDNYEAKGDEYNEEINDFGYKEWEG